MYRNLVYNYKDECFKLFTWDKTGRRIVTNVSYNPYLYIETSSSEYDALSIYNTKLRKKVFNNDFERRKFVEGCGVTRIFGNLPTEQQFLIDQFRTKNEDPSFSQHPIKVHLIDIETYSPDTFPKADDPQHTINVITSYDSFSGIFTTFGLQKDYTPKSSNHVYIKCATEKQLLLKYIDYVASDYPDIISGWNINQFDTPYIINRCNMIVGEEETKRLSPVGTLYSRMAKSGSFSKKPYMKWSIRGVSLLDYLDVYKRFSPGTKESFKLNSIAELEGVGSKVDYGESNLSELADTNWDMFIDYNIQDVNLLVKLDEKLQYLQLSRMLSYMGLTSFEASMGTISVASGACAIRLLNQHNKVIPKFTIDEEIEKDYEGAFVAEPVRGFSKNVVSFDVNSLYPNIMISLNLSPETKIGSIVSKDDQNVTVEIKSGKQYKLSHAKFMQFVDSQKASISKSNVLFSQKEKGILPEVVDDIYKKRVETKKKMKSLKQKLSKIVDQESPEALELDDELGKLDIKQFTYKIFINSIYGATANKFFPLFDVDIASSITATGQAVIKQSNNILTQYISKLSNIDPEKVDSSLIIKYNDTDSVVPDTLISTNKGIFRIEDLYNINDKYSKNVSCFGHEIISVDNLTCKTYNSASMMIVDGNIKSIIRHKVSKKKYQIVSGGMSVIMTEDHGCMVTRENSLIRVCPRDIRPGDTMICQRGAYAYTSHISSVECIGSFDNEYVYDIEMDDSTEHTFFANDILVHNSSYASIDTILQHKGISLTNTKGVVRPEVVGIVDDIERHLNSEIIEWGRQTLNSKDCRFEFKREKIADVAIFIEKKRYVMHVLDDEGIAVDKYKYVGVEVVRTTMPKPVKVLVKKVMETMLFTQSKDATDLIYKDAYSAYNTLPLEAIATTCGISNYEKFSSQCHDFQTCKGMPWHVKSAYFYNKLIVDLGLDGKYEKISSGDKVRCVHVSSNKYGIKVIGFKHYYPKEFSDVFKVNTELMFEKSVFSPIDRLYEAVGWIACKPSEETVVDIMSLFSNS